MYALTLISTDPATDAATLGLAPGADTVFAIASATVVAIATPGASDSDPFL